MLRIAKEYPEDLSEEYISKNSNYTVNNTFSSVRKNILNWYPFKKDSDILEIGAGMGSITGLLCDKAKNVTSIEMNELRADVIRTRYSNRKNLNVISQDINNWNDSHKYDYIVMIGVLEYAGIFTDGNTPFITFLNNVKKHLKEEGVLLCAIENRFGLKYWCGASEDHLGEPFLGIEGYKKEKTPVTFSKKQIENMLEEVELKHNRFYYVLPDYKFPNGIYTDEFMPSHEELEKIPFTYSKNSLLSVNEKDIYKDIIENKTLPFFANSYLFEASAKDLCDNKVIFATGRGESKKEYRITTIIDKEKNVYKIPAHKKAIKHLEQTFNNGEILKQKDILVVDSQFENGVIKSKFFEGIKADKIFEGYLKTNDLKSLYNLIDLLKSNLLKSSNISKEIDNILFKNNIVKEDMDFGIVLQDGYIDMTFYNCFYKKDKLIFFDQEWKFSDVPLNFILYYAIKTAYYRAKVNTLITFENLINYLGIKEERAYYDKLEEFIWANVLYRQGDFYGEDGYCNQYNDSLTLNQYLDSKEAHIELLLQSERDLQAKVSQIENKLMDKESELRNKEIELRNKEIELSNKEKWIQLLLQSERDLQNEVDSLNVQINNKNGHIELLLERDRELECIKNSRSWRLMNYVWKIRDKLVPRGSKRRLLIKIGIKFVKHPIRFIKKFTPKRIGKFFYYLKREGASGVSARLDECIIGNSNQTLEINISKVDNMNEKVYEVSDFEKLIFPKVENPEVSIIIPVYNQIHYTYACLKSILQNSKDTNYEIIIANDCSTDVTIEIDKIVENITVITTQENLRFLRNCNNAAKYAKGRYILFLNNDTQVQENWLEPLVTLIESDDSIGIVGSKLVYPDGRLQEAGGIIWGDASGWNYGRLSDPQDSEFSYVKECDYISGASMMIKNDLWKEIGGFDERFAPAYYEDSDLAFEVRKHGYKVMLQPLSIVVHFEGISNGTDIASGQKSYQVKNCETFKEKWKNELQKQFKDGENVFVARDRSKDKKHILVVDHYVPQYDKDAGSRTVYQYLSLFVKMGYSVSFIGDNFYRHEPYTTKLQIMGIEVLYGSYYANNWKTWVKENSEHFDVVLLNRPHISEKYIDFFKENTTAKIVYYGHDLHFLREMREFELTGEKTLLKSSDEWKKKEFDLMNKADIILYPSDVEVGEIKKINDSLDVRRLPAYIMENNKNLKAVKERKDLLFVGGFGHGPNVDGITWFCENIFPKVIEKNPNIKLNIVGSKAPDKVLALKSSNVNVVGFVSDEELKELYEICRVSVAPLRYGAGIKGKIIEAIANGIPVVTTICGAEGIANDDNFIIVDDNCEKFAQNILKLYEDENLIELNINKGFKFIEENYSADSAESFIKELFK
nr:glycosyltransferase [Clostridium botulinum]